jgi:hypothetical protein
MIVWITITGDSEKVAAQHHFGSVKISALGIHENH